MVIIYLLTYIFAGFSSIFPLFLPYISALLDFTDNSLCGTPVAN